MAALTAREFRVLLDRLADILRVGKGDEVVVRDLRALSIALEANKGSATKRAKAAVSSVRFRASEGVVAVLANFRGLAASLSNEELTSTLDSLLEELGVHVSSEQRLASASKPKRKKKAAGTMNSDLVADYLERLQAALGDDRKFNTLFESLKADVQIAQDEAVAIASKFYGKTSPGTSRAKALARIRERHDKLVEFTKNPSSAGRSAA
jgi:hypothetical protein